MADLPEGYQVCDVIKLHVPQLEGERHLVVIKPAGRWWHQLTMSFSEAKARLMTPSNGGSAGNASTRLCTLPEGYQVCDVIKLHVPQLEGERHLVVIKPNAL
jgi:16S rRNA G527 N7-methylase RsmG